MDKFGKKCPKCSTAWTKIPHIVSSGFWYICKVCDGKRAETLLEESKEPKKTPDKYSGTKYNNSDDFGYWDPTSQQQDLFDDWSDYSDNWIPGYTD